MGIMMVCSDENCGHKSIFSTYCSKCGKQMKRCLEKVSSDPRIHQECLSCHATISAGDNFCWKCGMPRPVL
jgi:hypothetical protein